MNAWASSCIRGHELWDFKVWANASEANQPSLRRRLRVSPGISDTLQGFTWAVGFENLRGLDSCFGSLASVPWRAGFGVRSCSQHFSDYVIMIIAAAARSGSDCWYDG